jgi:uncharacterized coiled-coil protein SlyX
VDKKFLEFWGNFLVSVAQGQQHLEDLTRLLQGDSAHTETLAEAFFKAYGLENLKEQDFQEMWEKSRQEFQESRRAYLHLLGGVPREDYTELEQRYKELQAQAAAQEETILQLRLFMDEKGLDYRAVTKSFQKLIKKQTQAVQDFFTGLAELQKKDT